MLNELYDIANALEAAGVKMVALDKRIKGPAKGDKLCIELGNDGVIEEVRFVPKDVAKRSWTIANGNKNSFPFVRVQQHLLAHDLVSEELSKRKKTLFKRGAKLADAVQFIRDAAREFDVNSIQFDGWMTYKERITGRLEKLKKIDEELSVVPETHERFLSLCDDFEKFSNSLVESLVSSLENPTEDLAKLAFAMLFEGGEQVCFEAAIEDSEFAITDPYLKAPISECLSNAEKQSGKTSGDVEEQRCVISNKSAIINDGAFPQANLPLLGRTPLFARKEDVDCRHRYGRKGVESLSVGQATISQMQAGLVAICVEENEGKTWSKIPSEKPSNRDLLIAYVESAPDVGIAEAFDDDEDVETDQLNPALFAEKASRIHEALRARQIDQKDEPRLRLMVIRKVDTANRKIIYSGSEPVSHFLASCDRWVAAFDQVPPIQLSIPVGRGKAAVLRKPHVIAPANFIVLSKERFKEDGKAKDEVPGGRFFDVLQLLLGTPRSRTTAAKRWLEILLPRRRQLLIGIAEANRRSFDDYKQYDAKAALATVSAFHVLLNNLERTGETYMREHAYKLGQLLAAADELHCGYCHDVRKGSLPSQLMGNALVAMAGQNPLKAFDVLHRRLPVYWSWAQKKSGFRVATEFASESKEKLSSEDQAEKNRQWSIANGIAAAFKAKPIASELTGKLTNKTSLEFRAELILGYMAGLKTETKT